jgi:lipocalin
MGMITLGRAGREHTYDVFATGDKVLVPIFGEDGRLTMILRRENENRYVGQWLEYERMPIVLQVADESWNRMQKVDYR